MYIVRVLIFFTTSSRIPFSRSEKKQQQDQKLIIGTVVVGHNTTKFSGNSIILKKSKAVESLSFHSESSTFVINISSGHQQI